MAINDLYEVLGLVVIGCPAFLALLLGVTSLPDRFLSEEAIGRCTQFFVTSGLLAAIAVLGLMLWHGERSPEINLGNWVSVPVHEPPATLPRLDVSAMPASPGVSSTTVHEHVGADHAAGANRDTDTVDVDLNLEPNVDVEHFHFELKLVFDRLSVPFVILIFLLCGTIGAFAKVYMHRESGYRRFFVLYAIFLLGMVISALAGTIETLFAGWELVGLSSALLVAFYQDRVGPVNNGLRVWIVYRVADAAFLVAAISLHHLTGAGDFAGLVGTGEWPAGSASMTPKQALFVGSMLLVAAAGKSALIPFSGWLPRAMEGPTPSSAIFYGALSVHLGAYLLLRVSPILALSPFLSVTVVLLGLASAGYGAIVGRAQTDIKSALSFASLTQVGIIVAEIGCGFRYLALAHLLGHACLRTLQLLRAPSLLMDYHRIENALGERRASTVDPPTSVLSRRLYRFAIERGYLDNLLENVVIQPFMNVFRTCDRWEQAWTDFLSGEASRGSSSRTLPVEQGDRS